MRGSTLSRFENGISIRWQITLPFILLALLLGLGTVLVINRLLSQGSQERFWRQAADSGQQASDAVVRIEQDLLEVERLIANTDGLADAVLIEDAEGLRDRVLPLILNADLDSAAVLDREGSSLLAVRHRPDEARGSYERAVKGEAFYAEWDMVQQVLADAPDSQGDKFSGIESVYIGSQELLAFYLAGPVRDESGAVIGVVLVGQYLDTILAAAREESGANLSLYHGIRGSLISSTHEHDQPQTVSLTAEQLSVILQNPESGEARVIDVAGSTYGEILLPLTVREGSQVLGVLGVSLLAAPIEAEIAASMRQVVILGALALLLVVSSGLFISQRVVHSLESLHEQLVQAAEGSGERLTETGSKELSRLAHSLNQIVFQASGDNEEWSRRMAGHRTEQETLVAVLPPEVDGAISTISTLVILIKRLPDRLVQPEPEVTLANLGIMLRGIKPIVQGHGGLIESMRGDEFTVHFGLSLQMRRPQVNSLQATHAAMEIREFIENWNRDRADRGLPAFEVGLAVDTGEVIIGKMDADEQTPLVVIGDVVQTAQQIARITQAFHGNSLLISEDTYRFLASAQQHFEFGRYGKTSLQGREDEVLVYEVRDRSIRLRD